MKDKNQELESISQKWSRADFITFILVGCRSLLHTNIHSLVTYTPVISVYSGCNLQQGDGGAMVRDIVY